MKFNTTTRSGPFWKALQKRGYIIEETKLNSIPILRLTNKNGNTWLTSTNISYPMTSSLVARIATDKALAYEYAQETNVVIPKTWTIVKGESINIPAILREFPSVIVKPLDSFGSKGITLNITTESSLREALNLSFTISQTAIIQQQVVGDELRFTMLDNEVVSVLLRQTPRIVGNGYASFSELLHVENEKRKSYKTDFIAYPLITTELIESIDENDPTILADGEVRELSLATMVKRGGTVYEILEETHQDYIEIAKKLTQGLATNFIVVDIFIEDYTKGIDVSRYWFNEFNTSPAIRMYYTPVNADMSHVADAIIDKFDKMLQKGL